MLAQAQQAAQLQQQGITISAGPCRFAPEEAVVKIQAGFRGWQARRTVVAERERQQRAALVLQVGRGRQACGCEGRCSACQCMPCP